KSTQVPSVALTTIQKIPPPTTPFPPNLKPIPHHITTHPPHIIHFSILDLPKKTPTSHPTIFPLSKTLPFHPFQHFNIPIPHQIHQTNPNYLHQQITLHHHIPLFIQNLFHT
ncbi:hypothetical protein, partial [Bacillus pumilus]|uniref:hypothetical protein n=1 Tax=Bacillus pumilus TaxID=1408 RepID=UPI003F6897B4